MCSIHDTIERLHKDDDSAFEPLMKAICTARLIVAVRPYEGAGEGGGDTLDFLSFMHDDMDYIPLFIDKQEFDEFYGEGEVEGEYKVIEMDGNVLATTMNEEQFLMINPVSGGIMFQGGHLKPFIDPAKLP